MNQIRVIVIGEDGQTLQLQAVKVRGEYKVFNAAPHLLNINIDGIVTNFIKEALAELRGPHETA